MNHSQLVWIPSPQIGIIEEAYIVSMTEEGEKQKELEFHRTHTLCALSTVS